MTRNSVRGRYLLALAAATLATPLLTPTAGADLTAPSISGIVYQSDGTPAGAAVIDVSVVTRTTHLPLTTPYARAVSQVDGSYVLDVTPTAEAATSLSGLPNGSPVSLRLAVVDLARAADDTVYAESAVLFADATVNTVPTLGGPGLGTVSISHVDPDVENILTAPDPGLDSLNRTIGGAASPAAVFGDPDLAAGHENVNDPSVVPPLGSQLSIIPLTEATSTIHDVRTVPGGPECHDVQITTTVTGTGLPPLPNTGTVIPSVQEVCKQENGDGGGTGSPCTLSRTYWFPEDGDKQPVKGIDLSTTIKMYHCTDEEDADHAYWGLAMDGWAKPVCTTTDCDDPDDSIQLWRYKHRIEAPDWAEAYTYMQVDPKQDEKDGGHEVTWSVGVSATGPSGAISDQYTPGSAGWMHPWPEDKDRQLYHISWIADNKWGVGKGTYWTGGGATYRVPKDTNVDDFASVIKRDVMVWRCWMEKTDKEYQWYCDPKD